MIHDSFDFGRVNSQVRAGSFAPGLESFVISREFVYYYPTAYGILIMWAN